MASGNQTLSKQTFAKVLSLPGVGSSYRLDAKLLNLMASQIESTEEQVLEKEQVIQGFNELYQQEPGVCQSKLVINRDYLPQVVVNQTEDFLLKQCESLAVL